MTDHKGKAVVMDPPDPIPEMLESEAVSSDVVHPGPTQDPEPIAEQPAVDEKNIVRINVNQKRLGDLVKVDELIALEEGHLKTIKSVLGRFVVGEDGRYLSNESGAKIIGQMTVTQLQESAALFRKLLESAAVPPGNGAV